MNMGVIQAAAEKVPNKLLNDWLQDKGLTNEQTDQLRSHLKLVRFLKEQQRCKKAK